MPRESNRARLIRKYGTLLNARLLRMYARVLHDEEDVEHDQLDDAILSRLTSILSSRYVSPRIQEVRKPKFNWFIHEQSDRGFLRSFRMERGSFHKLVELIQDHDVFACIPGKKKKASVAAHLLVFLKYIGTLGSDACVEQLGEAFEVGSGVAFNCIERTTSALLALYRDVVSWPSPSEREEVSARISIDYDFPNCVGLVDGTLLPLAFKPTACGEDYFTRKGGYAINAMMFCDDNARVTYMVIGWPGSTHDNRVWSNSRVYRSPERYFSRGQYLLGDSAFRASRHMLPPFKQLAGTVLKPENGFFNDKLKKIRVRSEHCIGLLKARFQYFKGVRILIKSADDLKKIERLFMCACVIHNLLIDDPLPRELNKDLLVELKNEAAASVEWEDTDDAAPIDTDRRLQIMHYLVESDGRF